MDLEKEIERSAQQYIDDDDFNSPNENVFIYTRSGAKWAYINGAKDLLKKLEKASPNLFKKLITEYEKKIETRG